MKIIKKIRVDNNGQQYILFRSDIYFTKYCLVVEIGQKGHTNRDLEFEKKKTRGIRKIRINTSKENYDVDYEASRIQTFNVNLKTIKTKN